MPTNAQTVACTAGKSRIPGADHALRPLIVSDRGIADTFAGAATWLFDTLAVWQDRISERQHLMALEERMLGDIGLSRADAEREGRKPFWRP